ncbi:MAG: hypothetical protein ACTHJ8_07920 [Mucilaginibacter sp.]
MKNISYLLVLIWIIFASCKHQEDVKAYHIKFSPIGNSDVFRDTLYFGMTNKFFPTQKTTIIQLITDSITLNKVVSFVHENKPNTSSGQNKFTAFGSFEISLYNENRLIQQYHLDRSDSKQYFAELIDKLIKSKSDTNLIKIVRMELLGPIQ